MTRLKTPPHRRACLAAFFILCAPSVLCAVKLDPASAKPLRCLLSDDAEVLTAFGAPNSSHSLRDGGLALLEFSYDNGRALLQRRADEPRAPFILKGLEVDGAAADIGCGQKPVLRDRGDLGRLDRFTGFSGVSLEALDLRMDGDLVRSMPFDTLTRWPQLLPEGFAPERILEAGKNPGLGVRSLHREEIDGRGISVALIDQPLLLGHAEYRDSIAYYDASEVPGVEPQMHAPAVAGITVGKTLGVAPGARLYYFAVPTWKMDNRHYARALEKILDLNAHLPEKDRIRSVSVSFGGFRSIPNYALWQKTLRKAARRGIFVSTCAKEPLDYLNLVLDFAKDPDLPESWSPTPWAAKVPVDPRRVYVPGGNRTVPSERGTDVYRSDPDGGLSWSAPYLAGLYALALQACPGLSPEAFVRLVGETAIPMPFGKVAAPKEIIQRCRTARSGRPANP